MKNSEKYKTKTSSKSMTSSILKMQFGTLLNTAPEALYGNQINSLQGCIELMQRQQNERKRLFVMCSSNQ